jgi:hypothetical protein
MRRNDRLHSLIDLHEGTFRDSIDGLYIRSNFFDIYLNIRCAFLCIIVNTYPYFIFM